MSYGNTYTEKQKRILSSYYTVVNDPLIAKEIYENCIKFNHNILNEQNIGSFDKSEIYLKDPFKSYVIYFDSLPEFAIRTPVQDDRNVVHYVEVKKIERIQLTNSCFLDLIKNINPLTLKEVWDNSGCKKISLPLTVPDIQVEKPEEDSIDDLIIRLKNKVKSLLDIDIEILIQPIIKIKD